MYNFDEIIVLLEKDLPLRNLFETYLNIKFHKFAFLRTTVIPPLFLIDEKESKWLCVKHLYNWTKRGVKSSAII